MQLIDAAKSDRAGLGSARARRRPHAFSLVEMMIVISIIILLTILVLATISKARQLAQATACLSNLHSIHSAFFQYAASNDGRFPPPASKAAGRSWESFLSPYIGPVQAFRCPADSDIFPSVGSSYDWRDTPDDKATLAGRLAQSPMRQDTILAFDSLPGWHGRHLIAAVKLNAGAGLMPEDQVFSNLEQSVFLGGR